VLLIEVVRHGVNAINLGERDLLVIERFGDTGALVEQLIRPTLCAVRDPLDCGSFRPVRATISLRCTLHQDAIRPEHRAVLIDGEASAAGAPRIQPSQADNHSTSTSPSRLPKCQAAGPPKPAWENVYSTKLAGL
jgi:hypothetical protein